MNFKKQMIEQTISDIKGLIKHGKARDEAIAIVRETSASGPAVWAEVLKQI